MNSNCAVGRGARTVGVGAATAVAFGLFSPGAAHADTFVPLPDGEKSAPGVTLTRTAESALVSPSLAANGAGRSVWVSGTVTANVTATPEGDLGPYTDPNNKPGTNNSSTHGASQVNTGYIVGCQVSIADNAISAGISGGVSTGGVSAGGSVGLKLGPGDVKFVAIDFMDIMKPGVVSLEYQDVEMQIQGCAGYAQARSYSVVEIIGDHYSKTTLYGAPFSIG
ncbi:mspA family protein [Nocardia uniformis]|uniref:MspA family protein n=1 Tax=Nocardia uniformis TaxID=53432 RepID=A0A849BQI7_9NOCA|nr:MspA family porin [Nocardia uniformis]NNH68334.1 mspA family protein [Nocardia uniformis]